MNKVELVQRVAATMREKEIKKIIQMPKQVFTISDSDGNSKKFTVRHTEKAYMFTKDDVEATFVINLYPIFEESPVSQAGVPTNNQAIVDILFTDSVANRNIYKESHYLKLSLPTENEQYDNFLGWGFAKDGEIILDKSGAESIFTIQLFSRGEYSGKKEYKGTCKRTDYSFKESSTRGYLVYFRWNSRI